MQLNPQWEYVSDQVMGGVSHGSLTRTVNSGSTVYRLRGSVSLENNGGFVQMAFDLAGDGASFDASAWTGVAFDVCGNGEDYDVRLRTAQLTRPWQSFRTSIQAPADWTVVRLPFTEFEPHRTDARFDPRTLRRVGLLGIGRVFDADISVRSVALFR